MIITEQGEWIIDGLVLLCTIPYLGGGGGECGFCILLPGSGSWRGIDRLAARWERFDAGERLEGFVCTLEYMEAGDDGVGLGE